MSKGRKNGCPTNVKNWAISIQDKSQVSETWVRIRGLTSIDHSHDSTTEDGSAATDLWEEPYVTKRSGSLALEGRPVVDASTGERDQGQEMLDNYALEGGCDGDATLKVVDPFGSAFVGDFIVSGGGQSTNDTEDTVNWDLAQVGELEPIPYVQVSSIALKNGSTAATTLSQTVGGTPAIITVDFTPDNASNQRFRISNSKRNVAAVGNVTDDGFTVSPLKAGTTTITVTSVNGAKTATLTVTVTDP